MDPIKESEEGIAEDIVLDTVQDIVQDIEIVIKDFGIIENEIKPYIEAITPFIPLGDEIEAVTNIVDACADKLDDVIDARRVQRHQQIQDSVICPCDIRNLCVLI